MIGRDKFIKQKKKGEMRYMVKKYKAHTAEFEAVQWTGGEVSKQEIYEFTDNARKRNVFIFPDNVLMIRTLYGRVFAEVNDMIVKDPSGQFYPCAPILFAKYFSEVKEDYDVVFCVKKGKEIVGIYSTKQRAESIVKELRKKYRVKICVETRVVFGESKESEGEDNG